MFEGWAADLVATYLGKFVDVQRDQLRISLWSGECTPPRHTRLARVAAGASGAREAVAAPGWAMEHPLGRPATHAPARP